MTNNKFISLFTYFILIVTTDDVFAKKKLWLPEGPVVTTGIDKNTGTTYIIYSGYQHPDDSSNNPDDPFGYNRISEKISEVMSEDDSSLKPAEQSATNAATAKKNAEQSTTNAATAKKNAEQSTTNAEQSATNAATAKKNAEEAQQLVQQLSSEVSETGRKVSQDSEGVIRIGQNLESIAISVSGKQGDRVLTGVANGIQNNHAINMGQLNRVRNTAESAYSLAKKNTLSINNIKEQLSKINNKIEQGLAASAALTGLLQPYGVGKVNLTASIGGYGDSQAIAVGVGYRIDENMAVKAGIAYSGGNNIIYNASFNLEW